MIQDKGIVFHTNTQTDTHIDMWKETALLG